MAPNQQPQYGNRFFKIMIPGCFEQKLKVPPAFCKKKLKREKSKRAVIEGCRGRFTIGVGRNRGDDQITFEDGWPRFVDQNELSVGDMLVFEHTQDLHFKVHVFGSSATERHFLDHPDNHHQQHCRGKTGDAEEKPAESQTLHFSSKMRPYAACKNGKVCIPIAFGRCHNLHEKSSVKLRDEKRREFVVKLQIQDGIRPFLCGGWHRFYTSNVVQIGDVCLFELDPTSLTSSTLVLDVKVLRINAPFQGEMGEDEAVAIMRRFFKIMTPGFREKLKLPPAFCEKLKQEKSKRAILESRIGMWEMKVCRNCGDDQIYFEDGWPRFVAENGLSVGDFLVFEHTQDMHFNVIVFDPSACEKQFLVEPENEHGVVTEAAAAVNPGKARVVPLHSARPYFTVQMKPYFASKRAQVSIPIEFVRSNNMWKKRDVTLRVRGRGRGRGRRRRGRRWTVKLSVKTTQNLRMLMGNGWHHFYESNELQLGNVCRFELNPTSPSSTTAVFDVQIFRC